jgi:hypothetical protein
MGTLRELGELQHRRGSGETTSSAMDVVKNEPVGLVPEVCERRARILPLSSPPQKGMKDPLRTRAVDGAFNSAISSTRRGRTPAEMRFLAEMPDRHEDKAADSRLAWARYRDEIPPVLADGAVDSFPSTLDVVRIQQEIDRFKYPAYVQKKQRRAPPSIMEKERSRFPDISLWDALLKWGPPCLSGRIKVIDECCGTGGNSDALAACPWVDVVAACDFVPAPDTCCEDAGIKCPPSCRRWKHFQKFGSWLEPLRTYRLNHPSHPAFDQDVTDDVAMDALYKKFGIEAAVGSTPCQDFTTLTEGKPNRHWVGGVTFKVIGRWVRHRLKLCVLENVPRMVTKPYDEWVEALRVWQTTHIVVILTVFSSQVPPSG